MDRQQRFNAAVRAARQTLVGLRNQLELLDGHLTKLETEVAPRARPDEDLRSEIVEEALTDAGNRWNLQKAELLGPGRSRNLVQARAEVGAELRALGFTFTQIAASLNKKDHSTIVHLLKSYPRRGYRGETGDSEARHGGK